MSVIITPFEQLEFRRPFTKKTISIKNPLNQKVAFKIKTTAPKQYCVRPNTGCIEPQSTIEVSILLQPFKQELTEDYKCRDKFLVQTIPIIHSEADQDIASWWSEIEVTDKRSIRQHKIKCVFLPPDKADFQQQESTPSSIAPSLKNNKNKDKSALDIELKTALEKIAKLEKQLIDAKESSNRSNSRKASSPVQPDDQHSVSLNKLQIVEGYTSQAVIGVALLVFIITFLFF